MSLIDVILSETVRRLQVSKKIQRVHRPNRNGEFPKRHYEVVVFHEDPVTNVDLSQVGNPPKIAFDVEMRVAGFVRQDRNDGNPLDRMLGELAEEIQEMITQPAHWHTFGGAALNAALGAYETAINDDATAGVIVPCLVTYRVFENRPTVFSG